MTRLRTTAAVVALCAASSASLTNCGTNPQTPAAMAPPPKPAASSTEPAAKQPSPAEQAAARAAALERRGVLDRAAQAYGEAFALEPRPAWLLSRAQLLSDAWAHADAVKAYEKLLSLTALPVDVRAQAGEGLTLAKVAASRPVTKVSDEKRRALEAAVSGLLAEGKLSEARALLEKEIQGPRDDVSSLDDLGVVRWLEKNPVDAQRAWARGRTQLSSEDTSSYEAQLMPPLRYDTRVLALGDGVLAVESIDSGVAFYDLLFRRFSGREEVLVAPQQLLLGPGNALAARNADGVIAESRFGRVPFATQLASEDPDEETKDRITSMALGPNGEAIAWGATDGGVRIASLAKEAAPLSAPLPERAAERKLGAVRALAFDAEGKRVAAGYSKGIIRVLTKAGRELGRLRGHTDSVDALSFGADGKLVSGSADGTVRLWDAAKKRELAKITHSRPVFYVRARKGAVDFASSAGVFRETLPADGKPKDLVRGALAVADSLDGKMRAVSDYKFDVIELSDLETGASKGRIEAGNQKVSDVELSRDGRWLAAAAGSTVHVIDLPKAAHWSAPLDGVARVALSPDGKLLAAGGFGADLVLWDLATATEKRRIPAGASGYVERLAFSPDGRLLAVQRADRSRLFAVDTGKPAGEMKDVVAFDYAPDALAVTDRGANTSGGADPGIRVFTGSARGTPKFAVKGAAPLDLAQQSKWLAGRDGDEAVVWDAEGHERFRTPADDVRLVSLSPRAKLLALAFRGGTVRVIDLQAQKLTLEQRAHGGLLGTTHLLWAAGGKLLVTSGHDGIKLWDPTAKQHNLLATMRFTADGWFLLTERTKSGQLKTAGFANAIVSDVNAFGFSGGLVWEGLRDDHVLESFMHCGRDVCGGPPSSN